MYLRLLHRGQRISVIGALASSGVVRTVDGKVILGSLIPEMLRFDGQNARSIVILDNCSILGF